MSDEQIAGSGSAQTAFEWANEKLQTGPIILGEHHDRAAARTVIKALIEAGSVNRLFLELADPPLEDYGIESRETLQQFLQARSGKNLSEDKDWQQAKQIFDMIDRRHANPLKLAELVEHAVAHEVRIYLIDKYFKHGVKGRELMQNRNRVMGEEFRAVIEQPHVEQAAREEGSVMLVKGAHSVVLVGAAHSAVKEEDRELSVQVQCGVSRDRVLDLSGT